MKKPRKKKNNNEQRKYRLARAFTSSYVMAGLNKNPVMLVDALTMKPTPMSRLMFDQLNNVAHFWSIVMVVMCRERNGKLKFTTDFIEFSDRHYMKNLSLVVANEHQELIDEIAKNNTILYHGWVATTVPKCDFDDDIVKTFFNELVGLEM